MTRQTALPLRIDPAPGFDRFVPGPNAEVVAAVRLAIEPGHGGLLSIWGAPGTGKSHLLQAAAIQAAETGRSAAYLPLTQLIQSDPEGLAAFETNDLLCLDEWDGICGSLAWQTALYRLYNLIQQQGGSLIIASRSPPRELRLELADLQSRLGWGPCYQLQPLGDADKRLVLQQLARGRGLQLPDEAAHYLLNRQGRGLHELINLLDRLDRASLETQRRLTVPFIREQLSGQ